MVGVESRGQERDEGESYAMKKHERELREERKLEMRKDSTLRKKLEEDLKEEMRRIVY